MDKSDIHPSVSANEEDQQHVIRRPTPALAVERQKRRKSRKSNTRRRTPGPGQEDSEGLNKVDDKTDSDWESLSAVGSPTVVYEGRGEKTSAESPKPESAEFEYAVKSNIPQTRPPSLKPNSVPLKSVFPESRSPTPAVAPRSPSPNPINGKASALYKPAAELKPSILLTPLGAKLEANNTAVKTASEIQKNTPVKQDSTPKPINIVSATKATTKTDDESSSTKAASDSEKKIPMIRTNSPAAVNADSGSVGFVPSNKPRDVPEAVPKKVGDAEKYPKMVNVDAKSASSVEKSLVQSANGNEGVPPTVKPDVLERPIRKFADLDDDDEDDGRPRIRKSFLDNLKETLAKTLLGGENYGAHRQISPLSSPRPGIRSASPASDKSTVKMRTSANHSPTSVEERSAENSENEAKSEKNSVEGAEKDESAEAGKTNFAKTEKSEPSRIVDEEELRHRRARKKMPTGTDTDGIQIPYGMPYSFNQESKSAPQVDLEDDSESNSHTMPDAMFRAPRALKITAMAIGTVMFCMVLLALQSRFSAEILFNPQIWMPRMAIGVVVVLIGGIMYGQLSKKRFVRKVRTNGSGSRAESRSKPSSSSGNVYTRERLVKML